MEDLCYTGSGGEVRRREQTNGTRWLLRGQNKLQAKRSGGKKSISVNNELKNCEQDVHRGKGLYVISEGVSRHLERLPVGYKVKLSPTKAYGRVEE
jgi:hypothetical protein